MCTTPSLVRRSYAGRSKYYTVPCGKCHECISKKQHEFAALGVLEAKRSSSMYMVAFTFKNSACPIMFSSDTLDGVHFRLVDDPLERNRILPFMKRVRYKDGKRIEYLVRYDVSDSSRYVPSLDRELMRLFVKKVRVQYKRVFGTPLKFTYAAFGEYGDEYKRPHFHFLIYNLTESQMDFVKKYWEREYGWCDVKKIPVLNRDGSPARVKVSYYVSKYVSKDKSDYDALLKGWVESPRRFSSLHFGQGVLDPVKLNSFTDAKI